MNILAPGFPAASALRTGLVPSVQAFVLRQRLDRALLRSADAPYGVVWSVAASSGAARPEPKPMNGNQ
jgi:hypothetical protein